MQNIRDKILLYFPELTRFYDFAMVATTILIIYVVPFVMSTYEFTIFSF